MRTVSEKHVTKSVPNGRRVYPMEGERETCDEECTQWKEKEKHATKSVPNGWRVYPMEVERETCDEECTQWKESVPNRRRKTEVLTVDKLPIAEVKRPDKDAISFLKFVCIPKVKV